MTGFEAHIKSRIDSTKHLNPGIHNFLVMFDDSISYTGDWYGPPDPKPGRETFNFIRTVGFETADEVRQYLEKETKNNLAKICNYKVIQVAKYLEPKTSVSISL